MIMKYRLKKLTMEFLNLLFHCFSNFQIILNLNTLINTIINRDLIIIFF